MSAPSSLGSALPTAPPTSLPPTSPPPLRVTLVRGRDAVLAHQPALAALAARSGQLGAVDYLAYIFSGPYVGSKTPTLLLLHTGSPADLLGAVLLYEYRAAGLNLQLFITDDDGGERTLLAPPELRPRIAATAAAHLLRAGARLIHLTLRADAHAVTAACHAALPHAAIGLRDRLFRSVLPLEPTYDRTLALMGKHTRRNLRYYERRATTELAATFVVDPPLAETDFLRLNRLYPYTVPDRVARWRLQNVHDLPGGFLVGLRCGDPGHPLPDGLRPGDWLSLLGGRRHHGTTEIAWQINHSELEGFSLTTAMRSHLLRHEIALGATRLVFEGGTPHSIHLAFLAEPVLDLLITPRTATAALIRRLAPRLLPERNALRDLLRDPTLHWPSTTP